MVVECRKFLHNMSLLTFRLFITLVFSIVAMVIFHFIPVKVVATIFLTTSTLLLSLDVCTLLINMLGKILHKNNDVQTQHNVDAGIRNEKGLLFNHMRRSRYVLTYQKMYLFVFTLKVNL